DELSTEECVELCDQLVAMGVKEVSLIGGEAYLHPGWLQVIERLSSAGVQVAIVTGGRGFTEERALAAKRAGLSGVSVSLDGLEHTHNELRGTRDSFQRARNVAWAADRAGLV